MLKLHSIVRDLYQHLGSLSEVIGHTNTRKILINRSASAKRCLYNVVLCGKQCDLTVLFYMCIVNGQDLIEKIMFGRHCCSNRRSDLG